MNANELAKLLEVDSWYKLVTREEIATMLRQQQAEIEALKQSKSDGNNKVNSKPVAWAVWEGRPHDLFFTKEEADELCRLKGGDAKSVALYTHSVKEQLTDEEIANTWDDVRKDATLKPSMKDMQDFARAIMKRCSIISGTDK